MHFVLSLVLMATVSQKCIKLDRDLFNDVICSKKQVH